MTSRPLRLTLLVTLLATAAVAGTPEGRLRELGLSLPAANAPVANYVPAVRSGNLIFVAGHIPRDAAGKVITGKVGRDATEQNAIDAAKIGRAHV